MKYNSFNHETNKEADCLAASTEKPWLDELCREARQLRLAHLKKIMENAYAL